MIRHHIKNLKVEILKPKINGLICKKRKILIYYINYLKEIKILKII